VCIINSTATAGRNEFSFLRTFPVRHYETLRAACWLILHSSQDAPLAFSLSIVKTVEFTREHTFKFQHFSCLKNAWKQRNSNWHLKPITCTLKISVILRCLNITKCMHVRAFKHFQIPVGFSFPVKSPGTYLDPRSNNYKLKGRHSCYTQLL
jgi:hypothetical protein